MKKQTAIIIVLIAMTTVTWFLWTRSKSVDAAQQKPVVPSSAAVREALPTVPPNVAATKEANLNPTASMQPYPGVDLTKVGSITLEEQVDRTFGDVLATLNLPPDELAKVRRLLVDRWSIKSDARDVVKNRPNTTATERWTDRETAYAIAEGKVLQEIEAIAGKERFGKIEQMLKNSTELGNMGSEYERLYKQAGSPISGEQKGALAEVLHETFKSESSVQDPLVRRTEGIDPTTGLSALDQIVVSRASNFLDPAQLSVLRRYLADSTHRMVQTLEARK